MCGFAGFLNYSFKYSANECINITKLMAKQIVHRGPDDNGFWSSTDGKINLAHQRLSIQDLSQAGHQPMHSSGKRFTLVFNGEIYNHLELRKLFNIAHTWRGNSDTETLVALFEKYGVNKAIQLVDGMFSIALWDHSNEMLYLIRDRFGEKPLYYANIGGCFIFASELKSLQKHPSWNNKINIDSLTEYFQFSFISGANSIYENTAKVKPAEIIQIKIKNQNLIENKSNFWSIEDQISLSKRTPFVGTLRDAAAEVESVLTRIIRQQLIADVPVGVFLSGGVDSRLIASLAQQETSHNLKTFNIGFDSEEYDESKTAQLVSNELKTTHSSINFSASDALAIVQELPLIYDEPFADATQMPAIMLSKLAKKSVSVSLSGEGGDELFGGYNRYISGVRIYQIVKKLPKTLRVILVKLIRVLPPSQLDHLSGYVERALKGRVNLNQLSRKLYKLSNLIESSSEVDFYNNMRLFWSAGLPINPCFISGVKSNMVNSPSLTFSEKMMATDTQVYLPDDLCVKVDRAAMSNSLETRLPFLDRELFNLAWSLPEKYKINNGVGKVILRNILDKRMPSFHIPKNKQGFSLPLGSWLRGDLKEWAEDLLSYDTLNRYSVLNKDHIRNIWNQHLSEKNNHEYDIWSVLMFIEWAEKNSVSV